VATNPSPPIDAGLHESSESYHIQREDNRIALRGDLRMYDAVALWRALHDLVGFDAGPVNIDLSSVGAADGGIVALLVEFRCELDERGLKADLIGASEQVESIINLYSGHASVTKSTRRRAEGIFAQIGRSTLELRDEATGLMSFLGSLVLAGAGLMRNPRTGHWKEIAPLCERTGANAVPIVILINFLVGCVMAFQSAKQLRMYGANVYVADLVGISMTRELAPLMTAIIVCSRSGAAFAAEIGSMKVNDEVDALRTLGISPFAWLAIPRIIALICVVPILTLMGDFVGVAGGLLIGTIDLDLTARGYAYESLTAIHGWDVSTGLIKSLVFSFTIAFIACQQGFAASGGAESVGKRTTSSVVTTLFMLVTMDALFTVIFRTLNL
jgi:phospholipid/cholesterol/gamma-HCH transport system permease protein